VTAVESAPQELLVTYTIFDSVYPVDKTERADVAWSDFVARVVGAPTYIDKKACPLISMAEYGDTISDKGSIRHAANVKRIYGVEVDYDGEQMPLALAAAKLRAANVRAVLYTSPSHKPEAPRWRVLLPLLDPAVPGEREALVGRANRILGGVASRESFTLSQSFYIGRVRGVAYETESTDGRCIDQALHIEPLFHTSATSSGETRRDLTTDTQLRAAFERGEDRYQAMLKLSARWAARGMAEDDIAAALDALFADGNSYNADGIDLRARVPGIARSAWQKFGDTRATRNAYAIPEDAPADEPPPWLDTNAEPDEPPGYAVEFSTTQPERKPLDWKALHFQTPPERDWVIPHWLGCGYVTLLAGPGGVGKSLLAQQIASHIATGTPFIEPIPKARKVLVWAGEDDHDEVWRRQMNIAEVMGTDLTAYDDLIIESFAGRSCTLVETVFGTIQPTKLIDELAEQVADYGAEVIVLDNIARLFGGNENERHHVTTFVNLVAGACNRYRPTAIVLLGHPAKSEGSEWAGSTAWEAAVRSRWYFGRNLPDAKDDEQGEPDPNIRHLARRKSNYSALDAVQLRYDPIRHTFAVDAPKAVLERSMHPGRAEMLVLDAIQQLAKAGISTSDEKRNPAFLPRIMVDRKMAKRTDTPALTDALYRLQQSGRVARDVVGKHANRTPKFGLVVAEDTPR
jgi:hypothetical protein